MPKKASKPSRRVSFVCHSCGNRIADPLYTGTGGHCPHNICAECWFAAWQDACRKVHQGGNWDELDASLFLLSQGYTQREAAELVGISARTIRRWLVKLRKKIIEIPKWLS